MEKINQVVAWSKVEERLRDYYIVCREEEGAHASLPVMLLKCFFLQKLFRIPSDPELEKRINDRISE